MLNCSYCLYRYLNRYLVSFENVENDLLFSPAVAREHLNKYLLPSSTRILSCKTFKNKVTAF